MNPFENVLAEAEKARQSKLTIYEKWKEDRFKELEANAKECDKLLNRRRIRKARALNGQYI